MIANVQYDYIIMGDCNARTQKHDGFIDDDMSHIKVTTAITLLVNIINVHKSGIKHHKTLVD